MELPLSPEIVPIGASKEEFGNATSILPCGLYEVIPAHRRALRIHSMTKAPSGLNACGSVGDAFEIFFVGWRVK